MAFDRPSPVTELTQELRLATTMTGGVSLAIDALCTFGQLNFRDCMGSEQQQLSATAAKKRDTLQLKKPIAISGAKEPWFAKFYVAGSQQQRGPITFSRR
jgi:hypothetical protein